MRLWTFDIFKISNIFEGENFREWTANSNFAGTNFGKRLKKPWNHLTFLPAKFSTFKVVLILSRCDTIRVWLKFCKIWLTIWPIFPENLTKIRPFLTENLTKIFPVFYELYDILISTSPVGDFININTQAKITGSHVKK